MNGGRGSADEAGIVADLGARQHYGSSWVVECSAKALALWLMQHFHIPAARILAVIADNLGASFGSASFMADGCVAEYYKPARNDTDMHITKRRSCFFCSAALPPF